MPTISACPSCDKKLKTPEGGDGRKIRCPGCKTELVVTAAGLTLPDEKNGVRKERPSPRDDDRLRRDRPSPRDEDEAPRRSRRDEDFDEEDDRPRRSRRREDEEDDRPRRSRRDEDEDLPRRRSRKGKSGGVPLWVWLSIGGGVLTLTLIVVLLFVFIGGGDKIKVGMTEAEVKAALGEPMVNLMGRAVYTDPPLKPEDLLNFEKQAKVKDVYLVIFEGGKVKKFKKTKPQAGGQVDKDAWNF
jgi:hypothetical protein